MNAIAVHAQIAESKNAVRKNTSHPRGRHHRPKEKADEGATRLLTDALGKVPQMTHVVIQEIDTENWGTSALAEG